MRVAFARLRKASMRCCPFQSKVFCTSRNSGNSNTVDGSFVGKQGDLRKYEAYRDLDKLNFATAAQILFAKSSEKKKFGFDFHLVQLFFTCMPALAVCLVAQYARYEIRRMEEELEKKTKVEEDERVKELELNATEEKTVESDPGLQEVKMRLEKLEDTMKEIVVGSNEQSSSSISKEQEVGVETKHPARVQSSNTQDRSDLRNSAAANHPRKQKSEEGERC